MDILNRILTALFGALMLPFRNLPPLAGLAFLSVITGILMLLVFKWASNQKAVAAARDRMQGRLLEMRLFSADPLQVLRAAGSLLIDNLVYMRCLLAPMLVLTVPVVLLLAQAAAWFEWRPVRPGESVVVTARFAPGASAGALDGAVLMPGKYVTAETPVLRMPSTREAAWRINPDNPGRFTLKIRAGGRVYGKQFVAGKKLAPAWPARVSRGLAARALNPGEPALPRGALREIRVHYPARTLTLGGRPVHWLLIFLIISLAAAWALRGVFRVSV